MIWDVMELLGEAKGRQTARAVHVNTMMQLQSRITGVHYAGKSKSSV